MFVEEKEINLLMSKLSVTDLQLISSTSSLEESVVSSNRSYN